MGTGDPNEIDFFVYIFPGIGFSGPNGVPQPGGKIVKLSGANIFEYFHKSRPPASLLPAKLGLFSAGQINHRKSHKSPDFRAESHIKITPFSQATRGSKNRLETRPGSR